MGYANGANTWYFWDTTNNAPIIVSNNTGLGGTRFAGNADTATTATNATNDSDGNSIKNTYLKLSGGTMTGNLVLNKITGTSNINYGTTLPSSPTTG